MSTVIDWYRVSKPQDDLYDTQIMAQCLLEKFNWTKVIPTGPLTMCNGTVGVVKDSGSHQAPGIMADPSEYPEVDAQVETFVRQVDDHLSGWPTGYLSLQHFLDEYYPKFWPEVDTPGVLRLGMRGSSSGHEEMKKSDPRNAVYVTFNDPWGCAQGIYHETAHMRLEAVGVGINEHDHRLIDNPITELFDSPVRFDQKRPMCAVVQGLYAWIVFTENDLWLAERGPAERQRATEECRNNIPKIRNGIAEVNRYLRPTAAGKSFFGGMIDWADSVVTRGEALLA